MRAIDLEGTGKALESKKDGGATRIPTSLLEFWRDWTGYPKAVRLEIFGPVFPRFLAETDPRDPPRSPGPASHINLHPKNQPRRPILRTFRGI